MGPGNGERERTPGPCSWHAGKDSAEVGSRLSSASSTETEKKKQHKRVCQETINHTDAISRNGCGRWPISGNRDKRALASILSLLLPSTVLDLRYVIRIFEFRKPIPVGSVLLKSWKLQKLRDYCSKNAQSRGAFIATRISCISRINLGIVPGIRYLDC